MLNWIMENWFIIVAVIALIFVAVYQYFKFSKLTKKQQLTKIKRTAYILVAEAEFSFGSKAGQAKFNYVYKMLANKFPLFNRIPKEAAYKIIDEALDELKEALKEERELNEID